MELKSPPMGPHHLASASGLTALLNANGSIRRMSCRGVLINLFLGNEVEGGPANIYLRRVDDESGSIGLLGPQNHAVVRCDERSMTLGGEWRDVRFSLTLVLAESASAWFWHVAMENRGDKAASLDAIYVQDLALTDYGAARTNEYYVSQYVDHSPLSHPERGLVLASRQNQTVEGRNPWCVIGSLGRGVSFATDALQVHGLSSRAGKPPEALTRGLPGKRLQHEHSLAAIRTRLSAWRRENKPSAGSSAGSNKTIRRRLPRRIWRSLISPWPCPKRRPLDPAARMNIALSHRVSSARRPCSTPWS